MNDLKSILNIEVDWLSFFDLVDGIGAELNERKNRFDKSDMFELAVEYHSAEALRWVNQEGYDHIYGSIKSEQKTQQHCLYTKKGKLKEKTAQIRLTNVLGDVNNADYSPKFDILQIVDTGCSNSYAVAYVSAAVVKKYTTKTKDAFVVQIPTKELSFVFRPDNYAKPEKSLPASTYSQKKAQAQKQTIEQYVRK